jgi:diguanylate cyclase (GGDEF)-like protein
MISVDPRTVVLFASILAALMTLILLSVRWSFGEFVHGLLAWVYGMAAVAVGCVLYAFRGIWPDAICIVLANALFLFSACSWTAGTMRFYGLVPPRTLLVIVCIAGTLLVAWYTIREPNYTVRLIAFTATTSLLYLVQCYVAVRHGERHFVTWFFAAALLLESLTMLVRCVMGILGTSSQAHFFSSDLTQVTYLLIANAMPLVLATGFFMAVSHKIQSAFVVLSRHDSLTNILNRRAFLELFHIEQTRQRRHKHALSVLLLDIDFFKSINDTFGHAAGDAVLIQLCETVQQLLRRSDAFGRIGGEEFAILLPQTAADSAFILAERIRESVAEKVGHGYRLVTLSIGVACLASGEETPQEIMRRADQALYEAKENGRNCSVVSQATTSRARG